MTGIYYPQLLDVLRAAGVECRESSTTNGWQTRARGSGGFPAPPLAVFWHHTASSTSPANDLAYMVNGSPDAPVGNMLLDRDGIVWPIAAGASNCAGKGGPSTFSRGTIPQDQGNTRGWQIEAANNGVGETWPTKQVDAYFRASNALSQLFGNAPTDLIGHAHYAPSRKIDPATAAAVTGPWCPRSINSSQTWSLDDMRAEAARRAAGVPEPTPPDPAPEEPDMTDEQARQLDQLYQSIVVAQPGFTAPGGSGDLNPPWASLWGYQTTVANVVPMLVDVQNRLAAIEAKLA